MMFEMLKMISPWKSIAFKEDIRRSIMAKYGRYIDNTNPEELQYFEKWVSHKKKDAIRRYVRVLLVTLEEYTLNVVV